MRFEPSSFVTHACYDAAASTSQSAAIYASSADDGDLAPAPVFSDGLRGRCSYFPPRSHPSCQRVHIGGKGRGHAFGAGGEGQLACMQTRLLECLWGDERACMASDPCRASSGQSRAWRC
jgi:hypothetical protein